MEGLENALERLIPIVENGIWDYCVLWKLGDDPNRFIEWLNCCCIGAFSKDIIVKDDKEILKAPICRDIHVEHPVMTMACRALAKFPSFIPLYSGVHGDVILTNQPMWLHNAKAEFLGSESSEEEVGTRVLVPIGGGLIELFAAEHVEKDERFIEFVRAHSAQCSDFIKVEAMAEQSTIKGGFSELPHNLLPELPIKIEPSSLQTFGLSSFSWPLPDYSLTYPNIEGSSSVTNFEPPPLYPVYSNASSYECLTQTIGSSDVEYSKKTDKNNASGKRCQSRNLITERNRRVRIRGGLYALRALVPKISKMDKSSILGDAIDYIEELKMMIKELEDKLKNIEEEDCDKTRGELKRTKSDNPSVCTSASPAKDMKNVSSHGNKAHIKVSVDLHQMDKREFLIRIICEKRQGGFVRLVQALNSLGFQVVDTNVTTSLGTVLYSLKVEGCKENLQLKRLRKTLIELTTG